MDDMMPVFGMIFSLLVILLIGGFILMYPLTRKLGAFMEAKMDERRSGGRPEPSRPELEALRQAVSSLEEQVHRLTERQQFVENLVERKGHPAIGVSGDER